jgi:hypothetical protein
MNQDTLQQIVQMDEKLMILHESWTDSKPEKKSTWAGKINAVLDERFKLMEARTITLRHRLASEDPRIVEYCFSDRPDEVFTDLDLLREHRGLTKAQLKATATILPLCK